MRTHTSIPHRKKCRHSSTLTTSFTCGARRYALGRDCQNPFARGPYRRQGRECSSSSTVPIVKLHQEHARGFVDSAESSSSCCISRSRAFAFCSSAILLGSIPDVKLVVQGSRNARVHNLRAPEIVDQGMRANPRVDLAYAALDDDDSVIPKLPFAKIHSCDRCRLGNLCRLFQCRHLFIHRTDEANRRFLHRGLSLPASG